MGLRLYNTLGREEQEFRPIHPGSVGMYCCGPTVYNYAHIGNLRMYVIEDTLRRTLDYLGYDVTHVMNITDVGHLTDDADAGEDKMLESSRKMGRSVWEIAEFFTQAFFRDTDALNIRRPTVTPRATGHIEDMIELISRIEENGFTYQAGGNLYFDTQKFPRYGELALLDRQEQMAGARIDVDPNKRHPRDFVLWFTRSKFGRQTMMWDSPWGYGYPGWHIECSAMSVKYLGEQFDIHCGGVDHIPVHHTNEIAQTEAATGRKWVNYWFHGEFLLMETAKMSKSKGGFVTLRTLEEEGFDPLDYRYFCLGGHYQSQLQFSYDALVAARRARLNLLERTDLAREAAGPGGDGQHGSSGNAHHGGAGADDEPGGAGATDAHRGGTPHGLGEAAGHVERFDEHLAGNLNTPKCLADLWALLKDENVPARDKLAGVARMDEVLGLRLLEERVSGTADELEEEDRALVYERAEARRKRDFARADALRDELARRGIVLEDTPQGTRWKKA